MRNNGLKQCHPSGQPQQPLVESQKNGSEMQLKRKGKAVM
jgi:hypothetical protein